MAEKASCNPEKSFKKNQGGRTMRDIAGIPCFSVKELVDFFGFSRSYISTLIAKTKEGKLSPPFPFYDFVTKTRHKYYFSKEAFLSWLDARNSV